MKMDTGKNHLETTKVTKLSINDGKLPQQIARNPNSL